MEDNLSLRTEIGVNIVKRSSDGEAVSKREKLTRVQGEASAEAAPRNRNTSLTGEC